MADMQRIKRELKYAGAVVDVYADTMKFKNGNTEVWDTVLHKKGAAAVIPVLPDGRIILVRQYRNALDKEVLEIPAGCKDSPDEESMVCAARELEEETGYHSDCLEKLFTISTTVAVFGETFDVFIATNLVHTKSNPDPNEFFNAYSIVNAEAIYDGQRGYETEIEKQGGGNMPDSKWLEKNANWDQRGFGNSFSPNNKRVFLLTRNGFASEQRYSTATWSGDIGTRWEDMKAQITAGLNFSISGVPYWSQDIGGFSVEKRYAEAQEEFDKSGKENEDLKEWRELNARWHQLGMFAPMYRSHGQFPFREPWHIAPEGHPAYQVISDCLQLRYRLMPYIYSIAADVHFKDYTMMRPLVMDFGKVSCGILPKERWS